MVRCFESLNWLAGRRDHCADRDRPEPGTTQFLFQQEVHARVRKLVNDGPKGNGNLANLSTAELRFTCWVPSSLRCCARPRLKGTAKYLLGIMFINKKGKKTKLGFALLRRLPALKSLCLNTWR